MGAPVGAHRCRRGGRAPRRGGTLPARARPGAPGVRSHCRFRNRRTEYVCESGIKRTSSSTQRQCDRALRPPRRGGAGGPGRRARRAPWAAGWATHTALRVGLNRPNRGSSSGLYPREGYTPCPRASQAERWARQSRSPGRPCEAHLGGGGGYYTVPYYTLSLLSCGGCMGTLLHKSSAGEGKNPPHRRRLLRVGVPLRARTVLGWPKRRKLAHAFLWKYSYKRLKLAQLLAQLGVFLTWARVASTVASPSFITFDSGSSASPAPPRGGFGRDRRLARPRIHFAPGPLRHSAAIRLLKRQCGRTLHHGADGGGGCVHKQPHQPRRRPGCALRASRRKRCGLI
jgi:hypothetical protein